MKHQFKSIVFFFGIAITASQFTYSQQVVTLQDALTYALENSEVMKQARLDVENGAMQVKESLSSAMPQINASSSITGNPIVSSFVFPASFMGGAPGEFMTIRAGQKWSGTTQFTLSQQIYNQQVFSGLKAAKGSASFYELAAQLSEENVLQQVASTYYQLVVTKQKKGVLDANIMRVVELEKIVASQVENGLAKKVDLDRVKVNKANLEAQNLELDNAIIQMENLLKYYMGMPMSQTITVPETAIEELEKVSVASSAQGGFNVDNLISYRVLNKQAELLGLQTKVYKAGFAPTLALSAHYTYNTQSDRFDLYSKKALSYDMSAITLQLNVPIFDGLAKYSRVKQSEIQLKKLRSEMTSTQNALTMSYMNAQLQIENSLKTIEAQQLNRQLANDVFEQTNSNYKLGLASLTDLINAEAELRTAENSYHEALLQYKVAEIELIKAKGEISTLLTR